MEPTVLILVAEDEPIIGLDIEETLSGAGYRVRHVSSGVAAMAVLDEANLELSGLVTDIYLGTGPTGWDVAVRAREAKPHIPVVYVSGDSAHEHTIHGVPDSLMLQKPFAPAQLVTAVSTLLNAHPSHPIPDS